MAKYKACICEGGAERAILELLLEQDKLIFSKEEGKWKTKAGGRCV